jgi:hypothetical protein
MVTDYEKRCGTGDQWTFLCVNEERGKGNRQKGMKNTRLMALVLVTQMKDFTYPIPEEVLEEINEFIFKQVLKYAVTQ